jgi:hypothetical protein
MPVSETHRGGLVVWADDIEVALLKYLVHHVVHSLLWCPCTVRFGFTAYSTCQSGVYPTGTTKSIYVTLGPLTRRDEQCNSNRQCFAARARLSPRLAMPLTVEHTLFREDFDRSFTNIVPRISPTPISLYL